MTKIGTIKNGLCALFATMALSSCASQPVDTLKKMSERLELSPDILHGIAAQTHSQPDTYIIENPDLDPRSVDLRRDFIRLNKVFRLLGFDNAIIGFMHRYLDIRADYIVSPAMCAARHQTFLGRIGDDPLSSYNGVKFVIPSKDDYAQLAALRAMLPRDSKVNVYVMGKHEFALFSELSGSQFCHLVGLNSNFSDQQNATLLMPEPGEMAEDEAAADGETKMSEDAESEAEEEDSESEITKKYPLDHIRTFYGLPAGYLTETALDRFVNKWSELCGLDVLGGDRKKLVASIGKPEVDMRALAEDIALLCPQRLGITSKMSPAQRQVAIKTLAAKLSQSKMVDLSWQ